MRVWSLITNGRGGAKQSLNKVQPFLSQICDYRPLSGNYITSQLFIAIIDLNLNS